MASAASPDMSGWMTAYCSWEIFKVTSITKCKVVLCLFRFAVPVLDLAREQGLFYRFATRLLKLQPLDGSVQGHFKKRVEGTSDAWSKNNPGKIMKICKFPYRGSEALSIPFTQK